MFLPTQPTIRQSKKFSPDFFVETYMLCVISRTSIHSELFLSISVSGGTADVFRTLSTYVCMIVNVLIIGG